MQQYDSEFNLLISNILILIFISIVITVHRDAFAIFSFIFNLLALVSINARSSYHLRLSAHSHISVQSL